ncbi:alpha/beta hydrolase [Prosthecomicrobium sp. N25]|uniref:alpha/beta hydrolase n=1 Tax=Prosthecomicrobium sp. N25 TaxID=3129254 RepID=UPI003076EA42
MPLLDGPRLAPAYGGPARHLVVLLHGYGADGHDLLELGRVFARVLPTAAFVAPNAPERCGMAPVGYQWFPLTFRDPTEFWRGVNQAAPLLDAFLDDELARHGLGDEALALVGFSQGTMMALHVAPRRRRPIAGVVGFSGLLAGAEALAQEVRTTPPVLLVHGDADEVVPVEMLLPAAEALSAAGLAVEWHRVPGLGHGIDEDGLALAAGFLGRVLGP